MLEVLGIVGTVLAVAAYLPQIISLVRSRRSADLDLRSWVIWFMATSCILACAMAGNDPMFKVLSASNFTFVTITLGLICLYRGNIRLRWGERKRIVGRFWK
ncbi:MAG: PQ-loop domain-containing transporter [Patescibacteria group bacterium]|nr:PQ-loop domain-containing transporter [Patescibacteria group bacterium]